ncbi:glycine-rich protein [Gordonia soli]|nr:glycine-rich protein [Gordonia soli]
MAPGSASAALPAECVQPDLAGVVTCTYTAAGPHTLELPAGVGSVQVTAIGGHGGTSQNRAGGKGAEVTGTIAVPPRSRTLVAVVAGNGADTQPGPDRTGGAGGVGGGGRGGTPPENAATQQFVPGAGGGGASDIRTAGDDLDSRVLVAAGGGGGAYNAAGGNAGDPGPISNNGDRVAAQPGTSTAGGAGGAFLGFLDWAGSPGTKGNGGTGSPSQPDTSVRFVVGGGGGGAGVYGGGGGAPQGGGAGGSSMVPAGGTLALSDKNPSITITYRPPTPSNPPCPWQLCIDPGKFGSS